MKAKKVWFVTGTSKGLGLTLVKKLLASGYRVAATSRTVQALSDVFGGASDSFLPLEIDLTDHENVKQGITRTIAHFGQIDVVVNNAGFGLIGTLEELSDAEVKNSFEVNVFGSLNVIRSVAPYLRKQQSGHIFNIASIGGYAGGFAGFGIYCSTKFAVAGFTEALAEEMQGFQVRVTLVYPGYFRTNFLAKGSVKTAVNPIEAYELARQSEQAHLTQINGNQPNDPEKAADVLIEVSEQVTAPIHLFLGKDAYEIAHKKIDTIRQAMEQNEVLGKSTDVVK